MIMIILQIVLKLILLFFFPATVYINVLDENDNPPRVSQAVYEANVDEDANVGASVAKIEAHDPDMGEKTYQYEENSRSNQCG